MRQVVFLDSATIEDGINIPSSSFAHEWTHFGKTNATQTLQQELIVLIYWPPQSLV
ncbi:MAG: hypothetical protein ACI89W_001173 [Gammaproteobacteria bacterium]|jgi:hypothetical protein